ncbi:MAG: PQQ-binding-like beta-propeller repeat protein [Terriglobia bacterium]
MKRALLLAVLIGMISPVGFCQNMFRGNPARTGVYATDGPRQFNGVKWAFKTDGWVLSSPALAGGLVYFGSDDKNLYALDASTGAEKWKFSTGGPVRSSPAVVAGTVYFGSYDGSFYALDAVSGKLKWKFETAGEKQFEAKGLHGYFPRAQTVPDFWDFFLSSPAVKEGLVYFGSGDGNLCALDLETGQLKWKFATQGVVHSSPAVAGGVVYFGSWDSYLYALDAATGQEKWKFKTGEDKTNFNQVGIQSSPAVDGGVVYFGCRDSHLYAVDAQTGQQKWNFPTQGSWVIVSPVVRNGVTYFATSDSALFHAVDAATGKERFTLPTGLFVFSSPALAGGMAYFGSFNGKLYAVDLKTGQFAWEFQTQAGKKDALGVVGPDGRPDFKAIFRSQFYEDMYRAGEKLFSLGSIISSPTVDRGIIYVGSTDGNLYALE